MGFIDKLQDSFSTASAATKIKSQQSSLRKERKGKLQMIGEQAVNAFRSGTLSQEELRSLCEEVAGIDGQIVQLEEELQATKAQTQKPAGAGAPPSEGQQGPAGAPPAPPAAGQANCPQCGAAVSANAKFCPGCGSDLGVAEGGPKAPPPPPPPPTAGTA